MCVIVLRASSRVINVDLTPAGVRDLAPPQPTRSGKEKRPSTKAFRSRICML